MESGLRSVGDRSTVLVLVAAVSVVVSAPVAVAAVGGDGGPIAQTSVDADTVTLRVAVAPDGSATWRVAYRVALDDENATDAFESLRADIERDPGPYADRFASRMRTTMRSAENATGREMSISDVSVAATRESLPQGTYGVVTYRLEWAGFAAVDGDRIRAGDAIDQFFLDERTALTIAWPDGYRLASVEPSATTVDESSVTWQGRRDFGPGQPRIEVVPGTPTAGEAPPDGDETTGGSGLSLVGVAVVAILVVVGAGWFVARRDGGPSSGTAPSGGGDGSANDGPPAELLSNEERVVGLLSERGGRLKQKQVADELEWTDAKTSQVVGELREAGEVEVFRLGRENVLTLPDVSIEPEDDG